MNLVELVKHFRSRGNFEAFCKDRSLDSSSEVIEIYMVKPYSLESELGFFEIERTEGKVEFTANGSKYYNLFDFYYFLDAVSESNSKYYKENSDREIADRLLSYAINDA